MTKRERIFELGRAIKKARLEAGLTLRKFAKLIDCDIKMLSVLEHGTLEPFTCLPAFCAAGTVRTAEGWALKTAESHNNTLRKMEDAIK